MNYAIAQAIEWFGNLFVALIIIRAVLSWISRGVGISGLIFSIVTSITEPFVYPIRRLLQRSPLGGGGMMIDLAPMLTMLLMRVLTVYLAGLLRTL